MRLPMGVAAVIALVVLATSFPFSDLLTQHRQVAAEAAQLSQLQHQNAQLAQKRHQLSSDAEVQRLARQNYQLVSPGQSLFEVLPASSTHGAAAPAGSPVAGDPADQPLYGPANAPNAVPDPGLPSAPAAGADGAVPQAAPPAAPTGGFWSRVTSTLEFWK
jgi:TolA-binding protein